MGAREPVNTDCGMPGCPAPEQQNHRSRAVEQLPAVAECEPRSQRCFAAWQAWLQRSVRHRRRFDAELCIVARKKLQSISQDGQLAPWIVSSACRILQQLVAVVGAARTALASYCCRYAGSMAASFLRLCREGLGCLGSWPITESQPASPQRRDACKLLV